MKKRRSLTTQGIKSDKPRIIQGIKRKDGIILVNYENFCFFKMTEDGSLFKDNNQKENFIKGKEFYDALHEYGYKFFPLSNQQKEHSEKIMKNVQLARIEKSYAR